MTSYTSSSFSRFSRSADRAVLGGVCAGFADYFGINLRVLRILTVIAFFIAMPITVIAYIAVVLLVPAESHGRPVESRRDARRKRRRMSRKEHKLAEADEREQARKIFEQRCRSLDERLATIEKYVTSSRYSLDREFRDL